MSEVFTVSLMENLVTVLAYSEQHGRTVANTLDTKLLDSEFRTIAEACIDYWNKYDKPPADHTYDLLAHIIEDKGNRRSKPILRIVKGMVALADSGLNAEYILHQVQSHNRTQKITAAVLESAELLNSKKHLALADIEEMWHKLLSARDEISFDTGIRLDDPRAIMEQLSTSEDEFGTGIEVLDSRRIVPARKQLFMWLGASGRGKTHGLVFCGVNALRRRKKVLHISLEMDEARIAQRYYQALFKVPRRRGDIDVVTFDSDRRGRLEGFKNNKVKPKFSLDLKGAGARLNDAMRGYKGLYRNIVIKQFPMYTLTLGGLNGYLDTLEQQEKFIPDLILVDYPAIMKLDPKNTRESIASNVAGIRTIAVERNMAAMAAHQSNRDGAEAKMITDKHVAEAWPVVHHSDAIVSFSSSDMEFRLGLARGFVAKYRNEEDKFGFLMTQNYKTGQFCVDSRIMDKGYFDLFKTYGEEHDYADEDDE